MTPDELKAARQRLGLSQPKLARLLGVDAMTVNRWERGRQTAPPYLRLALERLEQQQQEQPQ